MTWAALVADALVGTDRRSGTDPADLLDRSAVWAVVRRAGMRSDAHPAPLPAPAPAETRPMVCEPARRRLEALLDGVALEGTLREAVLAEWLEIVRDRGQRVPPELLPALLSHGRSRLTVRPLIAAVGGARAHWLAEQNPEWTYLVRHAEDTTDPTAWATGSHAQRLGFLTALRKTDPAAALALLTEEWGSIPPLERADLLATLRTGLSAADEPLLESGLDDKRKEVRAVAADLLTVLPDSAFAQRAAQRARQHLVVTDTGLDVRLPEACDKATRRDGITPKPPAGTGERAWWLEEILARAPLSVWPPPQTMRAGLRDEEFADAVHRGLARAAAAQGDATWAAELLDTLGTQPRDRELRAALYPLLPPEQTLARATTALASGSVSAWGPLLEHCPRPWPAELSELVLTGLSDLARRSAGRTELHHLARLAALRLPVSAATRAREIAQACGDSDAVDTGALQTLAHTLSFRHEMTQEIA